MSREQELIQNVKDSGTLIDRLIQCRRRIGKMCSEGRLPKMSIPVQWDDDDWFISRTLEDAIAEIERLMESHTNNEDCPKCGLSINKRHFECECDRSESNEAIDI